MDTHDYLVAVEKSLQPVRTAALIMILMAGRSILHADPSPVVEPPTEAEGINWSGLLAQSLGFLAVEHGFRWLTEEDTRHTHRPFFDGYLESLNGLHGWQDGDPFLVNYVGHPMEGSVAGFLFVQNDRKYRGAQFGRNRPYWKSRLRAAGYAWAYSEQFEIGPLSEASIGHTQAMFPQQGFVDQVVTPTIGLAWMIAEDSLDRYLIAPLESHIRNPYLRVLIRGGLNPTRSMANALALRVPWYRDNRPGIWESSRFVPPRPARESSTSEGPAPFEFLATARAERYVGEASRGGCVGGGGAAAFRVAANWQIVADVSGCKLTDFGDNINGDSLTYMVGPRWNAGSTKRWEPYAQILIGGRTLTHEQIDPVLKAQLEAAAAREGRELGFSDHYRYARQSEITGLAVSANTGVDLKLSPAIAIRGADFTYMHSWHANLNGINYSSAIKLTAGLIVRFGVW